MNSSIWSSLLMANRRLRHSFLTADLNESAYCATNRVKEGKMDYAALVERILNKVDDQAYMALADVVDPEQHPAMVEIETAIRQPDFDPVSVRELIRSLHRNGRIDKVHMLSAMHVLAASPRVSDYVEAARIVAEQEMAALDLGGPRLQANLASIDRHRGVLAFIQEHYDIALDYFSRAFERQHTAGNLSNVLATLLRLGDMDEARDLYHHVHRALNPQLIRDLDHLVDNDPDLALLRLEA